MTTGVDYADAQGYLQHFRDNGCHSEIVDNTEGIFNLCWLSVDIIDQLKLEVEKKKVNIVRLKELISGMNTSAHVSAQTEKKNESNIDTGSNCDDKKSNTDNTDNKAKGHGRRGVDDYPGAKTVACQHEQYTAGDICPQCRQGQLQQERPKVRIQIDGNPPLTGTRYELEKLVCKLCTFSTTAQGPVDLKKKYTEKAKAVLAYLHYGLGLPYYRLAKMQDMLGVPIAVSTQSELMASMMGPVHAMVNHLITYAAQCDRLFQDDTGVKIQSLIKENKEGNPARKGMFTSGFIAEGEHTVVLYFSGRAHAGENFDAIMAHRDADKGRVIRMADALSANSKHSADALEVKCNAHAFRRFRSLLSTYPEAAHFVLDIYSKVYDNEAVCKAQKMDDQARLDYHQEHTQSLMDDLEHWFSAVLSGTEVEPNSVLATECQYLSNHWQGLTQFLRIPGAPLDNNALEAILKYMIIYRKNSQTFKTAYSAEYGSRFVSIMVTCMVNSIDAIDYLTQLQIHEPALWHNPGAWTPWQYQQTLTQLKNLPRQAA